MKLQEIKKLVTESKHLVIHTTEWGTQYIGTDTAQYQVDPQLRITAGNAAALFDLGKEELEKITIEERDLEGMQPPFLELRRGDVVLQCVPMTLKKGKTEYLMLYERGEAYLVDRKRVDAAVKDTDYREYRLGRDHNGYPAIIVYDGMIFAGVMRPESPETAAILLIMMKAFATCEIGGRREETGEENAGEGEQMSMEEAAQ